MSFTAKEYSNAYRELKTRAEMERGKEVSERHARIEQVDKYIAARLVEVHSYRACMDDCVIIGLKIARSNEGFWEKQEEFPSVQMMAKVGLALEFSKETCAVCKSPTFAGDMVMGERICTECIMSNPGLREEYMRRMHIVGATGATGPAPFHMTATEYEMRRRYQKAKLDAAMMKCAPPFRVKGDYEDWTDYRAGNKKKKTP